MTAVSYQYLAVDSMGMMHQGRMNGGSQAAVLDALCRQGWVPLEVGLAKAAASPKTWGMGSWRTLLQRPSRSSSRELLMLMQSLSVLLGAGLTVDRALQINAAMNARPRLRLLNDTLLKSVRAGQTLSAAFAGSGQALPNFFRSMVEAGEVGGALPQALARIVELQERQIQIGERVRSALVYPMLLGGVVLLTLIMLLTFVLPRFEVLFAESEQKLPLSTLAVLAAGRFVADYWWALLALAGTAAVGFYAWRRSQGGRRQFDAWLLRTWLTFRIPQALNVSRFLRTVSTLCQNGTPLPAALRIARGTLSNHCLHAAIGGVITQVQAGTPLSHALAATGLFPEVAVQLTRVGEESGQLENLLLSSAKALEEDCQIKLDRLLALLVPALTIGMGLLVGGLIGSVLIGLLSVNDLAT